MQTKLTTVDTIQLSNIVGGAAEPYGPVWARTLSGSPQGWQYGIDALRQKSLRPQLEFQFQRLDAGRWSGGKMNGPNRLTK